MRKVNKMYQNAIEENMKSMRAYVTELKENVAKLEYQKELLIDRVLELEAGYDDLNCHWIIIMGWNLISNLIRHFRSQLLIYVLI
ncbi:hypothetical protein SSX86_030649 [Deinandra increscens subsp. villosa]|uniref:Uncharacterized protein n=1 Tax=Deinandra increscens subsp. villosa TaxID=3103831 RepID=A0AAP0GI42_9ASTR